MTAESADDGYFPRGRSLLRRVHCERAVGLFFGQRALCIGALKPLNYVGTSEHSDQKATPFARLARTGRMFEAVFFGSRREADRVLDNVHRRHLAVTGTLPSDAGPAYPAGSRYSALDPQLMLWTIAVMADSARCFYELLVRRLDAAEREALWQDYRRFGELFGLPRDQTPASHAELCAYWDRQLAGDDLHLTDEARYIGHAVAFEIPMPAARQPGKRVHDLVMLGSLPPRVRELYGLRFTRARALGFRAAVAALRAARPLAPASVLRGPSARSYELVAATERRRIARGRPTPRIVG